MQILRRTNLEAFKKAQKLGGKKVINLLKKKALTGRGGAGFSTGTKWEYAYKTKSKEKYIICNADEGEPGTFKDRFILKHNPETLIEGIMIACLSIKAKMAFIYLRDEYTNLRPSLEKTIKEVQTKANFTTEIRVISGGGAYVCGDETAIIKSIEGFRGHPYLKPPFPPIEGLWGKPTIVNNVETLTNVAQAILYKDWNANLRLMSVSGNVTCPGIYELPVGTKLSDLMKLCEPENKIKAVYFGCFGGCLPYSTIELTPENVCGQNCAVGSYTIIVVDEKQSILDVSLSIAHFYSHESCGKCTPCREGTVRIYELLKKIKAKKATKEDMKTLKDLAENTNETSLCGLGQTATNHILTGLKYFRKEFEANLK